MAERNNSTKPFKRLEQHLTSGNLWLYILSMIKNKGKVYAYKLDERIESEFSFKPGRVMLYLVLYKLEGEGLITSKLEERRKYYNLTKKGRKTLESGKRYLIKLSKKL